ncbi:MAG TPA: Maf family protein [Chthoniobacterales bacterium]|nr:Maf family protein [Chthoniobacterales bacterium]
MRPTLLLASNSPRRRELLSEAGFDFEVFVPPVAESLEQHLTLRELTALNATRKALATARMHPKRVVLAADTLVAIDNQILGKPSDAGEAMAMIERLNGRDHEVCTSVFVCHLAGARSVSFSDISRVHFRKLSRIQIERYLSKVNPLDKAGAYAAQGFGSEIIDRIDGSFTNVVGLPMEKTLPALAEFGIAPNLEKS